jgi:hypothetical protein
MEQSKIAVKSKVNKTVVTKAKPVSVMTEGTTIIDEYGLKLTLDNSLKRFANDPFIIEHNQRAEKKLSKNRQDN